MKIALDTNVLISGFLSVTGPCQHIIKLSMKRHAVILSEYILEEFERKLVQKFKVPAEEIKIVLEHLRARTVILKVPNNPKIIFPDVQDIPLLSLLEVANVHYFITGDKELLALKKWYQTLILSPREAMAVLMGGT